MGFFTDLDQSSEPTIQNNLQKGFFADLPEEPSKMRSILSSFPKGLIKGAASLGQLHDPLGALFSAGISAPEEKALETALPTRKGERLEEFLETAGEFTPSFALGPESIFMKAAQIGAGSLSKSILKEAGAPEIAQDIGSAIFSLSPQAIGGAFSKKLLPTKGQKEVHNLLKNYGFSDKEITPFIQSEKKSKWLAKSARGFLDPDKFAKETKPVGDLVYDSIREKQKSLPPLTKLRKTAFLQQFNQKIDDIPYTYTDLIKKDIQKLKASEMRFKDFRDFEAALNRKIGSEESGKAVLGILKEPINLAERLLSPELYKEKELMNRAYKSRMDIYNRLPEDAKGNLLEKAGKLGPIGALAFAYTFGLPWAIKGYALKKGLDFAAAKSLTSPRFQNMQGKLLQATLSGNKGSIIKLLSEMQDKLDKFTIPIQEKTEE